MSKYWNYSGFCIIIDGMVMTERIRHMGKRIMRMCAVLLCITLLAPQSTAVLAEGEDYYYAANPYTGGWSNCTWSAWQLVYEATGIALPAFGYSTQWYDSAAAMGYTVSPYPRANSVGVWVGHVGYVADFDGQNIYVKEGGFLGGYNEGWSDGFSSRYGQALIGYIYLDGDAGGAPYYEYQAPTQEEIQEYTPDQLIQTEPGYELAIDPNLVDVQIENLEESVVKKYITDTWTYSGKKDELTGINDAQKEKSIGVVTSTSIVTPISTEMTSPVRNSIIYTGVQSKTTNKTDEDR